MEVVFLDNGLIGKGDHSYNLAANFAGALSRRKLRYRMFGFHALDHSIVAELGAIPHFQRSLYDGVDFWPGEKCLRSVAAFFRGAQTSVLRRSEHKTWTALNKTFEEDLGSLPSSIWNSDNLVIVPAISQNQIVGLIRYLLRQQQELLPRVVCQLMFPPNWTPWGQVSLYGEQFYRDAFELAAPLIGRSLFFTAENEAMAALYREVFGIHGKILSPMVKDLPVPFGIEAPRAAARGKVRLGFFGYSKREKGFHLLPCAIEICRQQRLDVEFTIQIQHGGWEHATVAAERALRAQSVCLLEGVLDSETYTKWTSRIDVMLLPYDPITFGMRGSGIFTDSVAAGRPVVASKGTFAGSSVENNQAEGEVFAPHTSEALAAAIGRLVPRLPACKARAAERAEDFARSNSPDAYIDVLLAHANI